MSGSVVDLMQPDVTIPDPVVLDTNVVVEWIQTSNQQPSRQMLRARSFIQRLIRSNQEAILTPTGYSEVLHFAIMARYKSVFKQQGKVALAARYGVNISDPRRLFKQDSSILQQYAASLNVLVGSLTGANVAIAEPDEFGPIASGRSHQRELLHLVTHYGLDTSDALILMEASRLGVRSIVTMDGDMLRARADFDIYTWL